MQKKSSRRRWYQKLGLGLRQFLKRIRKLFDEPIFIALTVLGNGSILLGALVLYYFERGVNPRVVSLLDPVFWAVGIVTTVGAGDFHPVTPLGKIVTMIMMVSGTALFWSYIALFAGALLSLEVDEMFANLRNLGRSVREVMRDEKLEKEDLHRLIVQLEANLEELRELRDKGVTAP
jgi:hypothetical protein